MLQQSWLHWTYSRTMCLSSWTPWTSRNEGQLESLSSPYLSHSMLLFYISKENSATLKSTFQNMSLPHLDLRQTVELVPASANPHCSDNWLNIYFKQWRSVEIEWEKNCLIFRSVGLCVNWGMTKRPSGFCLGVRAHTLSLLQLLSEGIRAEFSSDVQILPPCLR